jgi:hypothetical protein
MTSPGTAWSQASKSIVAGQMTDLPSSSSSFGVLQGDSILDFKQNGSPG